AREVVVDRLGDADDLEPLAGEFRRDAERVLAADRDQGVEPARLPCVPDPRDAAVLLVGIRARGPQDRAADVPQVLDVGRGERARAILDQALPAVQEAERLAAVLAHVAQYEAA